MTFDHERERRRVRRAPHVADDHAAFVPGRTSTSSQLPPGPAVGIGLDASDRWPSRGGSPRSPELATDPDWFTREFNREFAAQLHAFVDAGPQATGGPEVAAGGDVHVASGDGLTREQLIALFSPTQIDKLSSFLRTHEIPDRLFDGDDVGHATAQQRILLAGHILTTGHYRPGSFEQQVHARMCGHWVNLVYTYAGVAQATGRGVREQFDHTGAMSLSTASRSTEYHGAPAEVPAGTTAQFAQQGLPWDELQTLQPGDWLYVFNNSGSAGGNHSVIFSRWASGDLYVGEVRYRRAITMSQPSPDRGGIEETRLLGERYVEAPGGHVLPVTHIERVSASARPMTSVADLELILGSNARERDQNVRFAQQHIGREVDWPAIVQYVREQNDALIIALEPHMTERQAQIFRDMNTASAGDSQGQLPRLIRLHQLLQSRAANAQSLDDAAATQGATVEARHEAALADGAAEREHALEEQIATLHREVAEIEEQAGPIDAQIALYEGHREELRTLIIRRQQIDARMRELQTARRASSLDAATRAELTRQRADLLEQRRVLSGRITVLTEEEHDARADRREAQRAHRRVQRDVNQRMLRIQTLERGLRTERGAAGYYTAHGRVGRQDFNGADEQRRFSGLLSSLEPAPHWRQFQLRSAGRPTMTETLH